MVRRFKVVQHDATVSEDMEDLGTVLAGDYSIPVHVNRYALQADLPYRHRKYRSALRRRLLWRREDTPARSLRFRHHVSNACRRGILPGHPPRDGRRQSVPHWHGRGRKIAPRLIVNTVKNCDGEVAGIFAGEISIKAHREGVKLAERSSVSGCPNRQTS